MEHSILDHLQSKSFGAKFSACILISRKYILDYLPTDIKALYFVQVEKLVGALISITRTPTLASE